MAGVATLLRELESKYRQFVIDNAETVGQVESAARILSYFVPGASAAVSELLSSIVSLIVLINDNILRNAANLRFSLPKHEKYISFCLTIVDHVEVFLEIAAVSGGSDRTRWFTVALIQVIKAVLKLLLLFKYKYGVLSSPPIPALRRGKELITRLKAEPAVVADEDNTERKVTFEDEWESQQLRSGGAYTLKSSGRTVRTLASSGMGTMGGASSRPMGYSASGARLAAYTACLPTQLNDTQQLGECLHIVRPLVHLLSMGVLGQSSWAPYLLACGVDVTSLCLLGDPKSMNVREKEELKRRTMLMLLYFLRSPFYDRYSQTRLILLLGFLAYKIPFLRVIIRPLVAYLPVWQKVYFYVWAT